MWKKMTGVVCAAVLAMGLLTGCAGGTEETQKAIQTGGETAAKDEVVVTMPVTSEPEAGFDPALAGERGSMCMSR